MPIQTHELDAVPARRERISTLAGETCWVRAEQESAEAIVAGP